MADDVPLGPDLDVFGGGAGKNSNKQTPAVGMECTICFTTKYEAIRLRCGHAFCGGCLKRCASHDIAACPHCRAPHLLDPDALRAAMEKYRKEYRSWRTGATKGSKGEVAAVTEPRADESPMKAPAPADDDGPVKPPAERPPDVVLEHVEAAPLGRGALAAAAAFAEGNGSRLDLPPPRPPDIANVIAHIGVGGFSRSHLTYATDRLLRSSPAPWGITGVGLMPWDAKMCATLRRQDMLYTLVMQDAEASTARVVEAITEFVFVPEDGAAFEALAVDARLKIISLTVTEKGYYQDVATGDLDLGADLIARDVDDWRSAGRLAKPRTAFGFICSVLQRRRSAGLPAVTVLSCDNLPLNGDLCKRSTLRFAAAVDAELAAWIAEAATFPNSMVDRITPATEDAHRAQLADDFGVRDAWPVVSERFAQWVVEDAFVAGRPDWDRAFGGGDDDESVLFVGDVEPYETMKLRLLNSGHSALAAVGLLLGHRLVHLSLADPDVAGFLAAYMAQVAATLGPVPGVDIEAYQTRLVERFKNPKIADTLARLASDGSQKFNSTLAHALRAMRARDEAAPPPRVALALACFLLSFAEVDEMGQRFALADPRRDALAASGRGWLLRHALDAADATEMRNFLGLVFGDDVAAWDALVAATHAVAADVRARGLRAVLRKP